MEYFKRVAALTPTTFWINNVTRNEARLAIEAGATGCTQNPAYLSKMLPSPDDGPDLEGIMDEIIASEMDDDRVVDELQRRAIARICEAFHPIYEASGGQRGFVSIQANPSGRIRRRFSITRRGACASRRTSSSNIPATKDGLEAMAELVAQGVPVLATEVMSIDQVLSVCELHRAASAGMKHPAPFWMAHINGIFDEHLEAFVQREGVDISPDVLHLSSLALARKIHGYLLEKDYDVHYLAGGARGLNHFTDWVGARGA
jgi:transaldolase